MTTVLITGASGFIARSLAPVLRQTGIRTVGGSRTAQELPDFDRVYRARLGDSLQPIFEAEQVDAIVHGALAEGPDAYEINVAGTTRWLEEASAAGVSLQIFLSTLSATADAAADYGRAKFVLQQRFTAAGEVVFRLGVVVGDGGMFARMRESARRYPVVPMLDGGEQLVYVLGIGYLAAILRDCILRNGEGLRGQAWNPHQPRAYTLREVTEAILRHYGYRRLLLPIPARPILALLLAAEKLPGVKLPVTSANVRGLVKQGRQEIPSDFDRFGYGEESLEALSSRLASR
ncbi:MAG: NAD-dependent epimerase/dehydratase family protein [Chloroflexi bacterium]|nr:NAD-dependent epimerase/dehydratase family protein [Chloroflexota bacterium]